MTFKNRIDTFLEEVAALILPSVCMLQLIVGLSLGYAVWM